MFITNIYFIKKIINYYLINKNCILINKMREKWRKKRMRRLMRKRKKMRAKHK